MARPKTRQAVHETDPFDAEQSPKKLPIKRSMEYDLRIQAERSLTGARPNNVGAMSLILRNFPGGRSAFIEFVKLATVNGNAAASAFWFIYEGMSKRARTVTSFDEILQRAEVKLSDLLAGVVGHGVESMEQMANLTAAMFHPSVVKAMAKSALKLNSEIGQKDRELFLQAKGFLPVPKGTSIHLHANASANAAAAAATAADPSVPKFAEDLEALTLPKTTVRRQLAENQITVEGSVVSSQS